MATIDFNDANNDGLGTDFLGYLEAWDASFTSGYYGFFSNNPVDFVGNQFAVADSNSTTVGGVGGADTVVIDSGSAGDLYYDMTSHVLAGAVDGATFGQGLSYNSGTDTFSQSSWDIDINGLGLTGTGAANPVHNFVYGIMQGNPANLISVLNSQNNTFNGSSGDDVFYSFNGNDTLTGNGGYDTFIFGGTDGNDVITDFNAAEDIIDISAWAAGSALSVTYAYDAVSGLYDATITDGVNGSISVQDIANNSLVSGVNLFV
jgi:Ca2+-binding RTX toxin-like protein